MSRHRRDDHAGRLLPAARHIRFAFLRLYFCFFRIACMHVVCCIPALRAIAGSGDFSKVATVR